MLREAMRVWSTTVLVALSVTSVASAKEQAGERRESLAQRLTRQLEQFSPQIARPPPPSVAPDDRFGSDERRPAAGGNPPGEPDEAERPDRGGVSRPLLMAARTDAPPLIDGRLDDDVWQGAASIRDLRVDAPVEGAPLPEKTEIRVLYDSQALYLACWCYDAQPDKVVGSVMRRDASHQQEDSVIILIDPFRERRSGYIFSVNPVGAKMDGLLEEAQGLNLEWDGVWYAAARKDGEGWTAEVAIPFKSLNFPLGSTTWGFNIIRSVTRYNQFGRWANALQHAFPFDPGYFGDLGGLEGIEQGIGLDAVPSLAVKQRRDNGTGRVTDEGDPSIDLFYKITPSLTSVLTLNTDFSEADPDFRRANLTRFSLFFPEQRDFFLQDSGIFRFADFGPGQRPSDEPRVNGQPFFSRRIALDESGPLSLRVGGKVTGRIGRLNLGVLSSRVEGYDGVDGKWLSVARGYVNVLEESRLGFIATYGAPGQNEHNKLFGVDFNYRSSSFLGNKVLQGSVWLQKTSSAGSRDRDAAMGASLVYPNDKWNWRVGALEIQETFNPALGFANRTDIREYTGLIRRRWRPGWLRSIDLGSSATLTTGTDNDFQSLEVNVDLVQLQTEIGDELRLRAIYLREDLLEDFEIRPGIVIPKEHYRFDRYNLRLDSSRNRPAEATLELEFGQFFTGTRFDLLSSFAWRPSPHFNLLAEYERFRVRLPGDSFTTHIARLGVDFTFSPDVTWRYLIQWDNETDELSVNTRFRWIIEPGREFFVVVDPFFHRNRRLRLTSTTTELVLKLVWMFRF